MLLVVSEEVVQHMKPGFKCGSMRGEREEETGEREERRGEERGEDREVRGEERRNRFERREERGERREERGERREERRESKQDRGERREERGESKQDGGDRIEGRENYRAVSAGPHLEGDRHNYGVVGKRTHGDHGARLRHLLVLRGVAGGVHEEAVALQDGVQHVLQVRPVGEPWLAQRGGELGGLAAGSLRASTRPESKHELA